MAEYIEREALLYEMENLKPINWTNSEAENRADIEYGVYREMIKLQPSADVVEVVHGEWVHIKDYGGGKCLGHCSVCWAPQEADNPSALKGNFRYCRWCGAKMDGRRR